MIAKKFSYDGSGKRGKELMINMFPYQDKIYTGNLPDTTLEKYFDIRELKEEQIENELKNNPTSKDYIFCPNCEKNLAIYLEEPYAKHLSNGKSIDTKIAYFFWLSIIWRMSISRQFDFALSDNIEQNLNMCLHEYMDAVSQNLDTSNIIAKCNFSYRLLRYQPDLDNKEACFMVEYLKKEEILILILGDYVLCIKFNDTELPTSFSYYGLENIISSAKINKGTDKEEFSIINCNIFNKAISQLTDRAVSKRNNYLKELANECWKESGLPGEMRTEMLHFFGSVIILGDLTISSI